MKTQKISFKRLICLIVLIIAINSCSKDESESPTIKTGTWTGTGISFTVNSTPLKISNLEFAYSGQATGSLCSFDYESSASFVNVTGISGNAFTADINTFKINGNFPNDTVAEIEITWTNYDSNCDAHYTGNRIYSAHFQPEK